MSKERIFIEPRPNGDGFGAKHDHGQRAFITAPTQGQVIDQVRQKHPDAEVHVARVRHVGPGPDKYRKL